MTPLEIKIELMKRGISMRSIAAEVGVSANAVYIVINKRIVSRRIMEAVAKAIGRDKADVFPWYDFEKAPKSRCNGTCS